MAVLLHKKTVCLFISLLVLVIFSTPVFALDGGGDGGGGGGGGGGEGGSGGNTSTNVTMAKAWMEESSLAAFVADLKSMHVTNYWVGLRMDLTSENSMVSEYNGISGVVVCVVYQVPKEIAKKSDPGDSEKSVDPDESAPPEETAATPPAPDPDSSADGDGPDSVGPGPDGVGPAGPGPDMTGPDVADTPDSIDWGAQTPTPEEVEAIANTMDDNGRQTLAMVLEQDPDIVTDKKALLEVVQNINAVMGAAAQRRGDNMAAIETTLSAVDSVGQAAQFSLSFVPGVGWAWSAGLDGARGAASAYRDGKSVDEIVGAAIVNTTVSATIGKLSGASALKNAQAPTKIAVRNFTNAAKGSQSAQMAIGSQVAQWQFGETAKAGFSNKATGPSYAQPTVDAVNPTITKGGGQTVAR